MLFSFNHVDSALHRTCIATYMYLIFYKRHKYAPAQNVITINTADQWSLCYSLKVIPKNASVSEEFDHCVCLFVKRKRTDVSFLQKLGNHSKPSVPCKQQAMKILFYLSLNEKEMTITCHMRLLHKQHHAFVASHKQIVLTL